MVLQVVSTKPMVFVYCEPSLCTRYVCTVKQAYGTCVLSTKPMVRCTVNQACSTYVMRVLRYGAAHACYAMSGTAIAVCAAGGQQPRSVNPFALRVCYAMSGTGLANGAIALMSSIDLAYPYACATRCP
eukprot:3572048-Rhodomonas_salina.1